MKKHRESSFEILRTIIMFFIVVRHSLVHGLNMFGFVDVKTDLCIVNNSSFVSIANYLMTGFLMSLTSVAVNCYVLISGYFLINTTYKWEKLIYVWIQTTFYSLIIALFLHFSGLVDVGLKNIVHSMFPILHNEYWFVTKYFALIALAPFLSKLVQTLSQKEYVIGLIIFSVINLNIHFLSYGSIYSSGMGLLWFIYLFFVGGYIKLYNPFINKKNKIGSFFIISIILLLLFYVMKSLYKYYFNNIEMTFSFIGLTNNSYTFFISVLLFLYTKHHQLKIKYFSNLLLRIAPYTFGVYLIHDNKYMRELIWKYLDIPQYLNSYWYILIIISVSLLIFIVSILIDYVRHSIFLKFNVKNYIVQRVYNLYIKGCSYFKKINI